MEKGKIEFNDPTFITANPTARLMVRMERQLINAERERQAQIAQFQTLIELLEAGDVESVKSWLIGAVKTLERQNS